MGYQTSDFYEEESDTEEENFVGKLKGPGNYKGKLPFKCFDCGRVGNFFAKSPYETNNKEDTSFKRNKKNGKNEEKIKHYKQKKNVYANDESSSSVEDGSGIEDVLFMIVSVKDELSNNERHKS